MAIWQVRTVDATASYPATESAALMVSDIDIWRTAHTLVEQYGDHAPLHAAMRCDELLAQGDIEGRNAWLKILGAIGELLRSRPVSGEALN